MLDNSFIYLVFNAILNNQSMTLHFDMENVNKYIYLDKNVKYINYYLFIKNIQMFPNIFIQNLKEFKDFKYYTSYTKYLELYFEINFLITKILIRNFVKNNNKNLEKFITVLNYYVQENYYLYNTFILCNYNYSYNKEIKYLENAKNLIEIIIKEKKILFI